MWRFGIVIINRHTGTIAERQREIRHIMIYGMNARMNEGKEKECIPWQRETTVHIIKVHNRIREVSRRPVIQHRQEKRHRDPDPRRHLNLRQLPGRKRGAERRKRSLRKNRHDEMKSIFSSAWLCAHFSLSAILAGAVSSEISLRNLCLDCLELPNISCLYMCF